MDIWTAADLTMRWLWGEAYTAHCIEVASDPWRAFVWFACNISVAFSYFAIPHEIRLWVRALRLDLGSYVGTLFQAFIFYCGVSHLAMVLVMPTAPWAFIIAFFVPLAAFSVGTAAAIRYGRPRIIAALEAIRRLVTQ